MLSTGWTITVNGVYTNGAKTPELTIAFEPNGQAQRKATLPLSYSPSILGLQSVIVIIRLRPGLDHLGYRRSTALQQSAGVGVTTMDPGLAPMKRRRRVWTSNMLSEDLFLGISIGKNLIYVAWRRPSHSLQIVVHTEALVAKLRTFAPYVGRTS